MDGWMDGWMGVEEVNVLGTQCSVTALGEATPYKHKTYKHTNIQTYKHTNIQTTTR